VAIIILTILSKILLWPLGTKSYKSMSQMKKLQPLIKEIRDKYKDDRKKMNEEVMRLHRTYNINPLGGCLPMVVQIPVFFALYRMLDQAIELRHAPFIGWINDLSAPDRLFSLRFFHPFYGTALRNSGPHPDHGGDDVLATENDTTCRRPDPGQDDAAHAGGVHLYFYLIFLQAWFFTGW